MWTRRFCCAGLLCVLELGCSDADGGTQRGQLSEQAEPSRPPAPAAGSACDLAPDGVMTIERPMFPEREHSPTFGYSFKLFPGSSAAAPTVIYLPGGPGQTGIDRTREGDVPPPEYSLIETDLRGIGCNAAETADHYPDAFYNSVYSADDVLEIVAQLGLDNYILLGVSYGSALATITVSRAEARGLPAPRAVVLEGVLGRAFASTEPEQGYAEQWTATYIDLPADIQQQFHATPLPFGFSPSEWGHILEGMLPLAAVPETGAEHSQLQVLLRAGLGADADQGTRDGVRAYLAQFAQPESDDFEDRAHHAISCHELAEDEPSALSLGPDGPMVDSYDCQDVELDRPYSASAWPFSAPVYYYTGTSDPSTPPWQADVHYSASSHAPRSLVHVTRAGHNALHLNLTDCGPALWSAMASGSGVAAALEGCAWQTDLLSSK